MNPTRSLLSAKIPTLLGLGVLTAGIIAGVFLVTTNQFLKTQASISIVPQEIEVANITDTSASIYWTTEEKTTGFVTAGKSPSLGETYKDERDVNNPNSYKVHFVTLKNLTPGTTYYYKVNSGALLYPETQPLNFTTAQEPTRTTSLPPLIGQVLSTEKAPVEEMLVILDTPGMQKLAAVSKVAGNFIIPLSNLKIEDLTEVVPDSRFPMNATLLVTEGNQKTSIKIKIPYQNTLPPIVYGQDQDLTNMDSSPKKPTEIPLEIDKYDLNNDNVINVLDKSIILNNFGKNFKDKRTDLNGDGKVDQKDLDIINNFVPDDTK